jgi:hypothetical protein
VHLWHLFFYGFQRRRRANAAAAIANAAATIASVVAVSARNLLPLTDYAKQLQEVQMKYKFLTVYAKAHYSFFITSNF